MYALHGVFTTCQICHSLNSLTSPSRSQAWFFFGLPWFLRSIRFPLWFGWCHAMPSSSRWTIPRCLMSTLMASAWNVVRWRQHSSPGQNAPGCCVHSPESSFQRELATWHNKLYKPWEVEACATNCYEEIRYNLVFDATRLTVKHAHHRFLNRRTSNSCKHPREPKGRMTMTRETKHARVKNPSKSNAPRGPRPRESSRCCHLHQLDLP